MKQHPTTQIILRDQGLALINALLVVAALSSVAVLLLSRSTSVHLRQHHTQEVAQTKAYLDGFEALLVTLLDADRAQSEADTLQEAWAQKNYTVTIDQGQAVGSLNDMQGRFNINWLSGSDSTLEPRAFARLMQSMGQAETLTQAITAWVSEEGPKSAMPYHNRSPSITPHNGPMDILDQLRLLDGMTPEIFKRIAPVLTVLPSEPVLNINTAPESVLRAFLADMAPGQLDALLNLRRTKPFETADELTEWFSQNLNEEDLQTLGVERFVVSSRWFEADISARLGRTTLRRKIILQRLGETGKTEVKYRLSGGS